MTSLSLDVMIFFCLFSYMSKSTSIDLKILVFSKADMKMTGTSLNGANRSFTSASKSRAVLVSLSTRSHLLTNMAIPLFLFWTNRNILISCASIPVCASINKAQTSASSIARMARITE